MASVVSAHGLLLFVLSISLLQFNLEAAVPNASPENTHQNVLFQYHGGSLIVGNISVNLIWYGKFSPSQRAIVSDFIASLSKPTTEQPSVYTWLNMTQNFYRFATIPYTLVLSQGSEVLDENYSLGKSLSNPQLVELASKAGQDNVINVVLTSADVTVEGFCRGRCGTRALATGPMKNNINSKYHFIWVGNSETQCPGHCAWPFHEPINGPKNPPLVAPNKDVGVDGMVINVASILAGIVTNPFGNGFFQGPKDAPLEASSACPGIFGKGAYPGFAGNLLVDAATGASYNAHGVNGKKYLLPAVIDPKTSTCITLV